MDTEKTSVQSLNNCGVGFGRVLEVNITIGDLRGWKYSRHSKKWNRDDYRVGIEGVLEVSIALGDLRTS